MIKLRIERAIEIGERSQLAPQGSAIACLDLTPQPDLVIEVADSTLSDIGEKRLLYEELKVAEYWVIDVKKQKSLPLPSSPIMAAGDSYNPKFCQDYLLLCFVRSPGPKSDSRPSPGRCLVVNSISATIIPAFFLISSFAPFAPLRFVQKSYS
ncbi:MULTISPECIES: Uma2 family endonuclease [unclassified Microcoleus]|uniref:Uma2 family endonuclease n=1 Tax=unclassified Microcoleus TaxID=2642155 RepID=UPI002FCFCDA7